jgi:hypothetical protein
VAATEGERRWPVSHPKFSRVELVNHSRPTRWPRATPGFHPEVARGLVQKTWGGWEPPPAYDLIFFIRLLFEDISTFKQNLMSKNEILCPI